MNWAAMTPSELLSYAPLNVTTDLERALLLALEDMPDESERGDIEQAWDECTELRMDLTDAQEEIRVVREIAHGELSAEDKLIAIREALP